MDQKPFWDMDGRAPEIPAATFIARMLDPNCTPSAMSAMFEYEWIFVQVFFAKKGCVRPFDPCQGLRAVSNQTLLNACLQPGDCAHMQWGSLVGDSGMRNGFLKFES